MTMTREEYLEFTFKEHERILKKDHRSAAPGTKVVFSGFYGTAIWIKDENNGWTRTTDQGK